MVGSTTERGDEDAGRRVGDGASEGARVRSQTDERQATEVEVAVHVLNRTLGLGRPNSVRFA